MEEVTSLFGGQYNTLSTRGVIGGEAVARGIPGGMDE